MKEAYQVKVFDKKVDWRKAKAAKIDNYVWGRSYCPKAYARLAYVKNDGFYVKLTAYERSPKTVYKNNGDPVYKDSCLEFFCEYGTGKGYINCEVNSAGVILSNYGADRYNRVPIIELAGKYPDTKVEKSADKWSVTVHVGLDILSKVYGKDKFKKGDIIKGNFYKCGDECEFEHYGSYSPVSTPKPDFHRPEYFAKMKLV